MASSHYETANGHAVNDIHVNGQPGPSEAHDYRISSPSPSDPPHENGQQNGFTSDHTLLGAANNHACLQHIYENGFHLGHWADTVVHIPNHAYNMHALLLSRSPFLAHIMANTPLHSGGNGPLRSIYVPIEQEPEITPESFTLAVGYLYSSTALNGINPSNARSVLAAGCLLGGMDELCHRAYEVCRVSIGTETIESWLMFIQRVGPSQEDPSSGRATPVSARTTPLSGLFKSYSSRLRDDVLQFLIVDLPAQLHAFAPDQQNNQGLESLMLVYSYVPFDIFKKAVESPLLAIGSDQTRFRFAKKVIEQRKKPGNNAHASNAEETVVLAFGGSMGGGGSNVHVTRKIKKRPLWKVSN